MVAAEMFFDSVITSYFNGINLSYREISSDLMNLKFSLATVAGEEGIQRLMQLIRTWCNLKHWHIQLTS